MGRCGWVGVTAVIVVVLGACGGGDDAEAVPQPTAPVIAEATDDAQEADPTAQPEPTAEPEPEPEPTATAPPAPTPTPDPVSGIEVEPLDGGAGIAMPIPNPELADGWVVQELAFGGDATVHAATAEVGPDGFWTAEPAGTAPYRTRMIVRRPPAERFSGIVVVEWYNVTAGADTAPDWGFLEEEIQRRGHAYIGVSVQAVSVDGAEGALFESGLMDTRGLVVRDPDRYGDLEHPGDAYAYDIFAQAGRLAATGTVLGELSPTHVIGVGQSQSAGFLTGYLNTVHPLDPVYDGFLVHSRGSGASGPDGSRLDGAVLIRTDLDAPVLQLEAETDLTVLNFRAARQPDTDRLVTWEVAGTAHSDTFTLAAAGGLPRDPGLGSFIGCTTPINDGPHHEALLAALSHLVAWVVDGTPPPPGERIELDDGGQVVRDDLGLAFGGVRLPPVDAPLRSLSGDPAADGGACVLFGQTTEIPSEVLEARYGDLAGFVTAVERAAADAVDAGWLLAEDAETMVAEETARAEALGLS